MSWSVGKIMNGIVRHCSRRTHLVKCKGKVSGSSALQYRAFHASSILGDDNKGGDDGEVPDDFFDDEIEQKKEFLDILRVTEQKIGVENIAAVGESIDWSKIEEEVMSDIRDPSAPSNTEDETASKVLKQLKEKYSTSGVVDKNMHELDENSEGEGEDNFDFSDWKRIVPAEGNSKQVDEGDVFMSSGEDDKESGDNENSNIPGVDKRNPNMTEEVVEHLSSFKNLTQVPPSIMDYTQSHLKTEEVQDEHLNNFMSEHEPSRYRFDKQAKRHCPGNQQRRGTQTALRCHKIDLEEVHHLNPLALYPFLSDHGEIKPRADSGICARCQRRVAKTVKRARNFGTLPHVGEMVFRDGRPLRQDQFHDVAKGSRGVDSKSIV